MNWLETRSPRERMILLAAGLLVALFVLWQFVISPVFAAKSQSLRAQNNAIRDFVIVRDGVDAVGGAQNVQASLAPFDRASVVAVAREVNLPISRVQPENSGAIRVWFEDAKSASIFDFLSRITSSYNAQIERAQISRNDDGSVSAQLTLKAGL